MAKSKDILINAAAAISLLSLALFFFYFIPHNTYPAEDASMLYTYSKNLIDKGIITFNTVPLRPIEGATDFLWMIILGLLYGLGAEPYYSANILSALSLFGTAYIIAKLAPPRGGHACFFAISAFIFVFTPIWAAVNGFSNLFFGFFLILAGYFFWTRKAPQLFITGLICCLIRPDGAMYIVPITCCYFLLEKESWRQNLIYVVFLAVIPGLAYFFWRFHYFGELLPLPFYVKTSGEKEKFLIFHLMSLKRMGAVLAMFLPVLLLSLYYMARTDRTTKRRYYAFVAALIIIPSIIYCTIRLEQNVASRFQYPIILFVIMAAVIAYDKIEKKKFLYIFLLLGTTLQLYLYASNAYITLTNPYIARVCVAQDLNKLMPHGNLATPEAGHYPYYSGWNTIDLWGLNTPAFAKKIPSVEDIKSFDPDFAITVGYPNRTLIGGPQKEWPAMVAIIYEALETPEYKKISLPYFSTSPCKKDSFFAKDRAYLQQFQFLSERNPVWEIRDTIFIKKSSDHFREMEQILMNYGARSE